MNNISRVSATFIIWAVFGLIVTSYNVTRSGDFTATLGILGAVALLSTMAVWWGAGRGSGSEQRHTVGAASRRRAEKAKRGDRAPIERLADVLDEDEARALLAELQTRLSVESDGELVSLEELLAEREAQRQERHS